VWPQYSVHVKPGGTYNNHWTLREFKESKKGYKLQGLWLVEYGVRI
jgi:hypothetical protein